MSSPYEAALSIDNGGGTKAFSLFSGGVNPQPGTFAGDGATRASAVYIPSNGQPPVWGSRAYQRGSKEPDRIYTGFKRGMYSDDPGKSWNGGPPSYQLFAMQIEDTHIEACRVFPHFQQMMKEKRDAVCVVLPIPAFWSEPQIAWIEKGVQEFTSLDRVDAFVAEPVAAIASAGDLLQGRIKDGDLVAVIDIGATTLDISVMKFNAGGWDEIAGNAGSPVHAGTNIDCCISANIAEKLGYDPCGCFDPTRGLDLGHPQLPAKHRRPMFLIFRASEEVKIILSAEKRAVVAIDINGKLKELEFTREEFRRICQAVYAAIENAIRTALDGAAVGWTDVTHVMLAGGSSALLDIRAIAARATERDINDVFVSPDTTHAIASGAARRAFFADHTSMCAAGGLAFVLREIDANGKFVLDSDGKHVEFLKWIIGTGEPIPATGTAIETDSQFCRVEHSGPAQFQMRFYVARPGVHKTVNGTPVTGPLSEGSPLDNTIVNLDVPEAGNHEALVAVHIAPSGRMTGRLSLKSFPELDVPAFPIRGTTDPSDENARQRTLPPTDLLVLMDASDSMKGDKIAHAKEAIAHLANNIPANNVRLGLIQFGAEVRITAPLGTSTREIVSLAQRMSADNGTPLDKALHMATDHIQAASPADARKFAVVVCDGHPNYLERSRMAGGVLKQHARVFTVGIGDDVAEAFMRELASEPSDYQFGSASQLITMFDEILTLCIRQPQETNTCV
jgi:uncharacterized protein YegL